MKGNNWRHLNIFAANKFIICYFPLPQSLLACVFSLLLSYGCNEKGNHFRVKNILQANVYCNIATCQTGSVNVCLFLSVGPHNDPVYSLRLHLGV